jgi:hypothetical protein
MSDPMPGKPHDFVVRIEGLPLDEEAQRRIAGAIQGALLSELGRLDLAGTNPKPTLSYIPVQWLGIWLREARHLQDPIEFNQNLEVTKAKQL